MYKYFNQFGLLSKTGIDLPGEASTIMHKQDNVGEVELATISFGQSFQITPIRLLTTCLLYTSCYGFCFLFNNHEFSLAIS